MKWFVAAVLLLIVALVFNLSLLVYAMYVLIGVLVTSRFLTHYWATSLVVHREFSRTTAEVGDTVAVVIRIQNIGKLPIPWLLVEDLLPRAAMFFDPPSLKLSGSNVSLTMLHAGASRSILYQLSCNRRGYYQIGPLVLETGDLFGLDRRYRVMEKPHFLLVMPKVVPLLGYDVASRRPIGEVRMTYRLFEDPTRMSGIRDYQPGDPLARVHWRASARSTTLQSKVYEPSTLAGATIVLNFHEDAFDKRHEPVRSELSITMAASIANTLYMLGQQVGLVTNGIDGALRVQQEGWTGDHRTREEARKSVSSEQLLDRLEPITVGTRRGPEQFHQLLRLLGRLEKNGGLSLPQLLIDRAPSLPRDATVLMIVPRLSDEESLAILELRRRGFSVAAIISCYDEMIYADFAGPLVAVGIPCWHLRDESAIATICQRLTHR